MKTSHAIFPQEYTAIWDLDGTLLNSFAILEALLEEISMEMDIVIPKRSLLLQNFHGSLRDTLDNVFQTYLTNMEIDGLEQLFLTRQNDRYKNIEDHLLPDAVELSARLAQNGVTQIIVTNRDHNDRGLASPRNIVERSSLGAYIDHIICGDDSEYRKPDRRSVESLLSRLGVAGCETVVIGDQHVDAQLALNLGGSAIIVAREGALFAPESLTQVGWQQRINFVESLHDVQIET